MFQVCGVYSSVPAGYDTGFVVAQEYTKILLPSKR